MFLPPLRLPFSNAPLRRVRAFNSCPNRCRIGFSASSSTPRNSTSITNRAACGLRRFRGECFWIRRPMSAPVTRFSRSLRLRRRHGGNLLFVSEDYGVPGIHDSTLQLLSNSLLQSYYMIYGRDSTCFRKNKRREIRFFF